MLAFDLTPTFKPEICFEVLESSSYWLATWIDSAKPQVTPVAIVQNGPF